jgi:hypothetical protein
MAPGSRYSAAYIFINRRNAAIDINFVRKELKHRIPGMLIVHCSLNEPELICYVQRDDDQALYRTLHVEVGKLKDDGLILSPDTKLVTQEQFEGYEARIHDEPQPEAAWIEVYVETSQIELVIAALVKLKEEEDAWVVNAHAVLGGPDIIVYVEAKERDSLVRLIEDKIEKISSVARILTHPVYMRKTEGREKEATV